MDWWALSNASSIMQICSAIHKILVYEAFIATDSLISQSFVVAFVHPTFGAFQHNLVCKIGLLVVKIQAEWSLWQEDWDI